jgi:hypothetical protein
MRMHQSSHWKLSFHVYRKESQVPKRDFHAHARLQMDLSAGAMNEPPKKLHVHFNRDKCHSHPGFWLCKFFPLGFVQNPVMHDNLLIHEQARSRQSVVRR